MNLFVTLLSFIEIYSLLYRKSYVNGMKECYKRRKKAQTDYVPDGYAILQSRVWTRNAAIAFWGFSFINRVTSVVAASEKTLTGL
jgi:hypothetical protein